MGDAEYLAAFRSIILPVVRQFSPDIILISSGFSAASGHSSVLGGYTVSPECKYLVDLSPNVVLIISSSLRLRLFNPINDGICWRKSGYGIGRRF